MKADPKTLNLFKSIAKVVSPPPILKVSEWADKYRRLSSEASAEPGQWRTDRAPYQKEIMNAVNDEEVETVVVMSSAQVGKTEFLLNTIGYFVHQDPAPIMLVQPTLDIAESFSKDRLAPMLRDSPVLKDKVKTKSRDSGNTLLHKSFLGGHITMAGANSPSSLASRPIRIVLCDEVDRYPASAGTEGDPVDLVTKRSTTFFNRKRILSSTPTDKETSRIEAAYLESSMEQWCLPCPSCNELQPLAWGQINFDFEEESKRCSRAEMACSFCGSLHSEMEWKSGTGEWISRADNKQVRGFHLNELASPWKRWTKIVQDFIEAKRGGPEKLKVFINTSLGETWEEKRKVVEKEVLIKRRERYDCEVPEDVLVLTASVDVQDNRLEYEIVGWGLEKESWGIKYGVIMGDPGQSYVWKTLDSHVIDKTFMRKDGQQLAVMTTCIDSGGHFTDEVYAYCKAREFKRVWAIKGRGGSGIPLIQFPKKRNDKGVWLFIIGVDVGKDTVASRLKVDFEGQPGYCHFPIDDGKGYDPAYFDGITSEHRVIRHVKGQKSMHWEKISSGARNEPFDLRNYASAALEILNPAMEQLKKQFDANKSSEKPAPIIPKKKAGLVSKGVEL